MEHLNFLFLWVFGCSFDETSDEQTSDLDLLPYSIYDGATNQANSTVTNICRFLITLNSDGDPDNGIYISPNITNAYN